MQSTSSVKQQLSQDINLATAIDISEALDNCFFHAFALYHLANKQELPTNLFTVHPHDDFMVKHLKELIFSGETLEFYFNESRLFEKTMVLGILFRSWFVLNLLALDNNRNKLFAVNGQDRLITSEDGATFVTLLTEYQSAIRQGNLATIEEKYKDIAIFEANADYFRKFSGNIEEEKSQIEKYWNNQGYINYCNYLAQSGVKISHEDISPVLKELEIPYLICSKTTSDIVARNLNTSEKKPIFLLAINPGAAHYYLLLTEETKDLLEEYRTQRERYKEEREKILANESHDKLKLCENNPNWFLVAILPRGFIGRHSSMELLIERISEHVERAKSNSEVFQANTPMNRRKIVTQATLMQQSLAVESSQNAYSFQPSNAFFYLKLMFAVGATLTGVVLIIVGLTLSAPAFIVIGSILGIGGIGLCFFSALKRSSKESNLLEEPLKPSLN